MVIKPIVIGAILAVSLPVASVALGGTASATASTGTVKVHVKNYAGQPVKGLKFCPTKSKATGTNKPALVGKCGVTNSHGIALLDKVKPGHWWATYYAAGGSEATSSKKVIVKADKTTTSDWKLAE